MFFSAIVMIPREKSFDQFLKKLIAATGINFGKDISSRYDEIPAYQARYGEMDFILLGPDSEEDNEYRFELTCTTDLSLEELAERSGEFAKRFIHRKSLNSQGFVEFSRELAEALDVVGIRHCKPIIVGG